jgi:hypothetical protein
VKLSTFTDWAERQAKVQGSAANFGRALLSNFWATIIGPVFWIMLTPIFADHSEGV